MQSPILGNKLLGHLHHPDETKLSENPNFVMLASVLKLNAEVCISFQYFLDRQTPRLYLIYIG
jgi:hypothetical protein